MILSKKRSNLFKKTTIMGCMVFSLSVSCMFPQTVLAGPAEDPSISSGSKTGPGQQTQQDPTYTNPHYFDVTLSNPIVHPADRYSYAQMEQDIYSLSLRYGNHMTVSSIGQSLDGRNIYDVVIGNPGAPKQILIQGAIHAREYITVPLMMQQMESLLANYDTGFYKDMPISKFLDQVSIHFVPMSNPDGVTLSQVGESGIRSEELRQMIHACYAADTADGRTNLNYADYLKRWKSNARGVDLNHNFDANWAELNPTLGHFSASDFKGASPLSEPESQALANLVNQHPFTAVINYHAMGDVIYWDTANNKKSGDSLAMAQIISAQNGYQILNALGAGGLKDWLQKRQNPIGGITLEIGRSTCPVSFSEYPTIWNQNRAVPVLMLEYVLTH